MATNSTITHSGKVINIFRDTVTVAVESSEACGGCASRSACSLGVQTGVRNILVTTDEACNYTIGESVVVATRSQMGILAVLLCYAVPAVVLVATLAAAVLCGVTEGIAALISLGSVAVYYALLWLFRDKLAQRVSFTIHKE